VGQLGKQALDRDTLAQVLVPRDEHDAHSAATERSFDDVLGSEARSGGQLRDRPLLGVGR
jgi:hypothetical protein